MLEGTNQNTFSIVGAVQRISISNINWNANFCVNGNALAHEGLHKDDC